MEVSIHRAPLPKELPEGALSSKWLKRYAEALAERQGANVDKAAKFTFLPNRQQQLPKHMVWIKFPRKEKVTELLVFSKRPNFRYVISFTYPAIFVKQQPWKFQRFFSTFAKNLKLSPEQ